MTVDANRNISASADDSLAHRFYQAGEFIRQRVADRVRHVKNRGPCINRRGKDFAKICVRTL